MKLEKMAIETKKEKILYYAVMPIVAASAGAFVTSLIQGQSCLPSGGADLVAILKDTTMSGAQKLKALELYKEITGRPWSLVSTISGSLMGIGALVAGSLLASRRQ